MSHRTASLVIAVLLLSAGAPALVPGASAAALQLSQVDGRVYGPDRKPVDQAVVRVYDQTGFREIGRTMTDSSGRFQFTLNAGIYVVHVDPVTNPTLAPQRQELEIIVGPNARGGERANIAFRLKPAATAPRPAGPRFDQVVPAEAKGEYDRALKIIGSNRADALAALRKAVEIYPDYYDALELLGTEYVKDDHNDAAAVVLQKAVEVNPKGERSLYALGVAHYKAGRFQPAIDAFTRATAIVSDSANTTLYLGLAHARAGHDREAEAALKQAHSLGATGVPELHLALASIYRKAGRNREAAAELRLLLKESPNLKDADKIRGLIEKYEKE